jgi:trigger factor
MRPSPAARGAFASKGLNVNVTVENLAPCKKLLRVEVETDKVDAAFEEITRDFQRQARLPGFRVGKAPRHLVMKAYSPQIQDEVRRKLMSESFREALREQKLDIVGRPEVEETQFGRGQPLQFTATFETAPEFELPDYKGLPVRREVRIVTPEDVERAVGILLEERATYVDLARPVQSGDYVVISYTGTCDGKAITEIAPTARGLTEKKGFWVHIAEGSFIPGFTEQLVGASAGEKRTVTVQYPADFVAPQLAGLTGVYEVEIQQVKEKQRPELNDELAKAYGAETVEALRAGVQRDLENELRHKQQRDTRDQLVRELLNRVTCELPESVVVNETKSAVYDMVRRHTEQGASREVIDQHKDQIFAVANTNARDRIKASFVMGRIAAKEGIKAEQDEVAQRIMMMAEHYQVKPEQMVKQLKERNGLAEVEEQIISQKVLEFLERHARFEEILPGAPAPG